MADLSKLVEELGKLSVLEAAELVKMLEEKWGVSAAAPVAAMAATPVAAAAAEPVEEKTEFDVILKDAGPKKIETIKVIRQLTNLGLVEAKNMAETPGSKVLTGVGKEAANDAKSKLEAAGAVVELADPRARRFAVLGAPHRARGPGARLHPRLRPARGHARRRDRGGRAARGVRGRVRADLPRRGRERRLQPARRRGAPAGDRHRRAARVREIHAPDGVPAVAGVHRIDARGARRHRGNADRSLQAALRSRAA